MIEKHFDINCYTHNFSVQVLTGRAKQILDSFCRKLVQYGYIRQNGTMVRAALKIYASKENSKGFGLYRFHINHLKEFKLAIANNFLTEEHYDVSFHDPVPGTPVKLVVYKKWELRDYQIPVVQYVLEPPIYKFVGIQTGKGKDQPLDAKIKTPGGWSTMGEMKVGTWITAKDGSPTFVTGVYPQGKKEVFKVTFGDGRSTEAGANHLWKVYYINTSVHKRWRIVDTLEIKRLISMPNPRVYVDLIDPEEGVNLYLPIAPYILGLFIGDGSSASGTPNVCTPDEYIAEELVNNIDDDCSVIKAVSADHCPIYKITRNKAYANLITNPFNDKLKQLELYGKRHFEKFIPKVYLNASRVQRLALLQGLMDTDGTITTAGSSSYSTVSEQLALDVQYLVRSLGGIANITSRYPSFTYKGIKKTGRLAYDVDIRYKKPSELFRLPKKKDRTNDANQYAAGLKLRVSSVESVGIKETQCISISHPDKLYVTDDFIVTHNTFTALTAASRYGERIGIIVKAMYVGKWIDDCMKTYDIKKKDILTIRGCDQLVKLFEMAAKGELKAKIIVFSNATLRSWIKMYETTPDLLPEMGYPCSPGEMFEFLGIGFRIIDEVHQDFHFNYRLDTYTHVGKSLAMSATMTTQDDFVDNMYRVAYPLEMRYKGMAYDRYVATTAVIFRIYKPEKLRFTEYGSTTYSHNAFEKSIIRHVPTCQNYMKLISNVAAMTFVREYKKGQKLLIFVASIDMATRLTQHFRQVYPQYKTLRFVEEDPEENLYEADISISTLLSSGTARDIPNLVQVIMTTGVRSEQSNLQSIGRLRKLSDGTTPRFLYFASQDSAKQMEYHQDKIRLLEPRSISFKIEHIGQPI